MTKKEVMLSVIAGQEEDIISTYGEKYYQFLEKFFKENENLASSNIYRVLDDLERAVCLENPNITYHPGRNLLCEEGINFILMLPRVAQDVLFDFLLSLKFPKPEPKQ